MTKSQVVLDRPIKAIGVHEVKIALHPEVAVTVKVNVARSPEEADLQAQGVDVLQQMFEEEAAPVAETRSRLGDGRPRPKSRRAAAEELPAAEETLPTAPKRLREAPAEGEQAGLIPRSTGTKEGRRSPGSAAFFVAASGSSQAFVRALGTVARAPLFCWRRAQRGGEW